jgi:hypothetical protein
MKPIYSGGVEGRQRLRFTGIRLFAAFSSQHGERGGSTHRAIFPLFSASKRDIYLTDEDGVTSARVMGSSTVLHLLLSGRSRERVQEPRGTFTDSRTNVVWPLIRVQKQAFHPAPVTGFAAGLKTLRANSWRVLPICSSTSSPQFARVTIWPLLLRWDHTPEGRYFRPLLFLKFKIGEGKPAP